MVFRFAAKLKIRFYPYFLYCPLDLCPPLSNCACS